jgi:hypothetical protein
MRKIYLTLWLTTIAYLLQAQQKNIFLQIHTGIGSENNTGIPAFFAGAGIESTNAKRIVFAGGITRFSTGVYTIDKQKEFEGQEPNLYKSWFLTPKVGYRVIGQQKSLFTTILSVGPALQLYNYKVLSSASLTYQNGSWVAVPGTVQYTGSRGMHATLYAGIDFNFNLSAKCKVGLFADTYSHEIPLEFTLAGLKAGFKL